MTTVTLTIDGMDVEVEKGLTVLQACEQAGIEIGGSYNIGPGIKMLAGIQLIDLDDNLNAAGAENDATIIFVGTFLSF